MLASMGGHFPKNVAYIPVVCASGKNFWKQTAVDLFELATTNNVMFVPGDLPY